MLRTARDREHALSPGDGAGDRWVVGDPRLGRTADTVAVNLVLPCARHNRRPSASLLDPSTSKSEHPMNRHSAIAATLILPAFMALAAQAQTAPPPLETVRNFQVVSTSLASSGQIAYDQIPLLGEEGYEVVVNLAVADEERNGREGFLVAQEGLTYVHIPVDWARPRLSDVEMFFDVMKANQDRKVYVHCFANMRASAFVYLYRTLVEGVPETEALSTMNEIWDPSELEQWAGLIERAKAEYRPH